MGSLSPTESSNAHVHGLQSARSIPLLEVLTPTLNCAATILDTLNSVAALEARFPGKVVHRLGDGGSSDGTADLIRGHSVGRDWIHFQPAPGLRIPATLNLLLEEATGTWILILNGDDYLDVDNFVSVITEISSSSRPRIVCGQVSILTPTGHYMGQRDSDPQSLDSYMSVNHPAMLVHHEIFAQIGRFDELKPTAYDYVWTWRAFRFGVEFQSVGACLAFARLGGLSQRAAFRATVEVATAKFAAGAFGAAASGMVWYYARRAARLLLPSAVVKRLVNFSRRLRSSVDNY